MPEIAARAGNGAAVRGVARGGDARKQRREAVITSKGGMERPYVPVILFKAVVYGLS